ncbi:MAG: PadR family transcriptional regulator [Candidatus Tenebribacter burtonii]|jgi:DNA-binding PadR family transcriptional regulator|nr:PadR family transcriptional regulator [Candidatus Tenebribacter burtonii]
MSKVDLAVLGLLKRIPMHGYEMTVYFEKRGIDMWIKIKRPSVYKALNRLEKKGFISFEFKQSENSPPKKVYSITKSGEVYFEELLNCILTDCIRTSPFDFWNALKFAKGNITKESFISIVDTRLEMFKQKEKEMIEKHNKAELKGDFNDLPFYFAIVMKSFSEIKEIIKTTLIKIREEAVLPENESVFKKENE